MAMQKHATDYDILSEYHQMAYRVATRVAQRPAGLIRCALSFLGIRLSPYISMCVRHLTPPSSAEHIMNREGAIN